MSNLSKDLLREYIKEQDFKSADDILAGLKEKICTFPFTSNLIYKYYI